MLSYKAQLIEDILEQLNVKDFSAYLKESYHEVKCYWKSNSVLLEVESRNWVLR